jgi:hypothetical protein
VLHLEFQNNRGLVFHSSEKCGGFEKNVGDMIYLKI